MPRRLPDVTGPVPSVALDKVNIFSCRECVQYTPLSPKSQHEPLFSSPAAPLSASLGPHNPNRLPIPAGGHTKLPAVNIPRRSRGFCADGQSPDIQAHGSHRALRPAGCGRKCVLISGLCSPCSPKNLPIRPHTHQEVIVSCRAARQIAMLFCHSTRHRESGQEVFGLSPAFRCSPSASRQVSLFSNLPDRRLAFCALILFLLRELCFAVPTKAFREPPAGRVVLVFGLQKVPAGNSAGAPSGNITAP